MLEKIDCNSYCIERYFQEETKLNKILQEYFNKKD